jgi:hypothetical protein
VSPHRVVKPTPRTLVRHFADVGRTSATTPTHPPVLCLESCLLLVSFSVRVCLVPRNVSVCLGVP